MCFLTLVHGSRLTRQMASITIVRPDTSHLFIEQLDTLLPPPPMPLHQLYTACKHIQWLSFAPNRIWFGGELRANERLLVQYVVFVPPNAELPGALGIWTQRELTRECFKMWIGPIAKF